MSFAAAPVAQGASMAKVGASLGASPSVFSKFAPTLATMGSKAGVSPLAALMKPYSVKAGTLGSALKGAGSALKTGAEIGGTLGALLNPNQPPQFIPEAGQRPQAQAPYVPTATQLMQGQDMDIRRLLQQLQGGGSNAIDRFIY